MDEINGEFPQTDVALIIGANDVTNPAARTDTTSPIFGMPILDVDKARTVMVIKRSMGAGFAGIDNPLYYLDKTLMLLATPRTSWAQSFASFPAAAATVSSMVRLPQRATTPPRRRAASGCTRDTAATTRF